jgi:hypothetical protein
MKFTRSHAHAATPMAARARVAGHETSMTWYFAIKTNGMRPTGAPPD